CARARCGPSAADGPAAGVGVIDGLFRAAVVRLSCRGTCRGDVRCSTGESPSRLVRASAVQLTARDVVRVRRQVALRPLLPTDVQLLDEETEPCQLQGGARAQVSIVAPTIDD